MQKKIAIVSACLLGYPTRYDGTNHKENLSLQGRLKKERWIVVPICPEQLGGLPTPRPPANLTSAGSHPRVKTVAGKDITELFTEGADCTLAIVQEIVEAADNTVVRVFLNEGSPSCGVNSTHLLSNDIVVVGDTPGVTARMLLNYFGDNNDKLAIYGVEISHDFWNERTWTNVKCGLPLNADSSESNTSYAGT